MSPDDIFAAQFWPWPDPAIKRDAQGRVLFVNAAFLALYGGRVEDWRGNAVGGWAAPQVGGPSRFETRMPAGDGTEQVYDWMEQTLADGHAFALARNVTIFTQAPDPIPNETYAPEPDYTPVQQNEPPAAQQEQAADDRAFAQNGAPAEMHNPIAAHWENVDTSSEETYAEPDYAEPTFEPAPAAAHQPEMAAPEIPVPQIQIPEIEIPSDEAYALTEQVQPQRQHQDAPREFERRPLPIEDESAVLGNNWRDAVIAKAVGAADVAKNIEPAAAEVETPSANSDREGPIRILLAEDNAINALLTRTLLEADGHTVDTVEDGQLAVEAMKSSTYDLIFMDMRMPNMDGLEATRKIRTLPNVSKGLPIIALTANAFDDDRNACFDSGMNDFMTKPVSAEELAEKVRDWTNPEAKARIANAA
ncbi:hypothetical protein GCM10011309_15940 [Litorimonas cladophorae]|uniref:Response regulatory domain-containing protein n=1 Tax=Litorimonas cladophorae TaxID=1220491 RepID=A0A918NFQ9_9PROT|nr:response regulator [Litorimonas cladophorae]GGX67102.1 hypothetical protein GCM10011309_15940 [Litorimonas cladophorae]